MWHCRPVIHPRLPPRPGLGDEGRLLLSTLRPLSLNGSCFAAFSWEGAAGLEGCPCSSVPCLGPAPTGADRPAPPQRQAHFHKGHVLVCICTKPEEMLLSMSAPLVGSIAFNFY